MSSNFDSFAASGSSPTADFAVQNHGSISLLIPQNTSARIWMDDDVSRENGFQPYYPTVVIEHRYCAALIAQIVVRSDPFAHSTPNTFKQPTNVKGLSQVAVGHSNINDSLGDVRAGLSSSGSPFACHNS